MTACSSAWRSGSSAWSDSAKRISSRTVSSFKRQFWRTGAKKNDQSQAELGEEIHPFTDTDQRHQSSNWINLAWSPSAAWTVACTWDYPCACACYARLFAAPEEPAEPRTSAGNGSVCQEHLQWDTHQGELLEEPPPPPPPSPSSAVNVDVPVKEMSSPDSSWAV